MIEAAASEVPVRYRKRPVVITAMCYDGRNAEAVMTWIGGEEKASLRRGGRYPHGDALLIDTLEGVMTAQPGDYVIKGVQGEFYPCKPDIFEATYEPAEFS